MEDTAGRARSGGGAVAREAGFAPIILGNAIEGEARDVALVHAGIVRQVTGFGQPIGAPCVILSGGETTVSLRGNGRGGRNGEFLLALTVALAGEPRAGACRRYRRHRRGRRQRRRADAA